MTKYGKQEKLQESSELGTQLSAVQVKMARVALDLGVRDLAALAGVSPSTVARLEGGFVMSKKTKQIIRAALEIRGIEFIDENGGGPGVRLKRR